MPDEKPQLEETVQEVKAPATEDIQGLLQELNKIGVEKPEQIANMYTASQQAGQLANLLGETRVYARNLKQQVDTLQNDIKSLVAAQGGTYQDHSQPAPSMNLRDEIKRGIFEVANELGTQQRQAQIAMQRQWQEIQTDEDFPVVKDLFTGHLQNPEVQMALNAGQTSLDKEYGKVTKKFYRGIAKRSRDVIEGLQKSGVMPPHMESSASHATPSAPRTDNAQQALREVAKKATGSDADVDKMLDALFPKGDPFFQTGR